MNSFGTDKAITIRYPSTANLMIDSQDRDADVYPTPWDFQIVKAQSIQNGFFTRIATTEVVFKYVDPNVSSGLNNDVLLIDLSGIAPETFAGTEQIDVPAGNYTTEELLDIIVAALNTATSGTSFSITNSPGFATIIKSTDFALHITAANATRLSDQLNIEYLPFPVVVGLEIPFTVDLRPYTYIDIVSPQITYAQDLKDNATQDINRDVLCRWYFADDVPEQIDGYGFPILMGYKPFVRRRLYNPPKQIKWDNNLPLGNLSFQLYDEVGDLITINPTESQFYMTLQLSEN